MTQVTIVTIDHYCTQRGDQCGGQVLQEGAATLVRKFAWARDGKLLRLFDTEQQARDRAAAIGYQVEN